jgi:hypothetical protein
MGIFRDPKCGRCNRIVAACICTRSPAKALKREQPRPIRPKKR